MATNPFLPTATSPARVLLVDDEGSVLALVKNILTRFNYEVSTALSGSEGLKLVHEEYFDCIITDAMMPVMSGYDFVRAVRKNPYYTQVPILMLTRKRNAADVKKAVDAGVNDYILKPIDEHLLLDKVSLSINKGGKRHTFELPLMGFESLAMINLEAEILSISEAGLNIWLPIALGPDIAFTFTSRLFSEIGIEQPFLKLMQCHATDDSPAHKGPGFHAQCSFMGVPETDLKKIRSWIQKEAIRRRK